MNIVLLLIFNTIVIKVSLCDNLLKCCGTNEVLIQTKNGYNCTQDLTKRHQIKSKNINYLKTNTNGTCIDVFNNEFVNLFITENRTEVYNGKFFPKCCPLNSLYDLNLHSCVERKTDLNYINETFVKVGLPHCKIIADFPTEDEIDFQYNLLDSTNNIKRKSLEDHSFCFDKTIYDNFVLRECQQSLNTCSNLKCIKKCCPDGQSFVNGPHCVDTYQHGLNLSIFESIIENYKENFAIIHNKTCRRIYKMKSNITLHKNGSFTEWSPKSHRTEAITDLNSYCVEHSSRPNRNESGYHFFHCFLENSSYTKFQSRIWPFILSCTFLLLTVFVYVIIKEYKKMFGKILMNYCLTSFFLFAFLLWNHMTVTLPPLLECQFKSFLLIFVAVAQFTWANVMSFEIWCTFGTTNLLVGNKHKRTQTRKYILYNMYAWGVPLLVTLIVYLFYNWRVLPDAIQPYMANRVCFIETRDGNYARFLFFSIPLLIIQVINTVFFIKTVIYCMQVKNEINKVNEASTTYSRRKYQHDKERLFLIVKLSIVMGISSIFEVVTGFFKMSELGEVPKYIEIVWDNYNALQGVFIFIIFICKKKVIITCLQKLNIIAVTPRTSASTRTQSSMTYSGIVLNHMDSKDKL